MAISGALISNKYRESIGRQFESMQRVRENVGKMESETGRLNESMIRMKSLLPANVLSGAPDQFILAGLDDIKSRIKDATVAVTEIENKDNEVILPVSISAPMKDYAVFIGHVRYLQNMRFPFFSTTNVSVSHAQDLQSGGVVYKIEGTLRMPKNTPTMAAK
jgi:hypothetical protein